MQETLYLCAHWPSSVMTHKTVLLFIHIYNNRCSRRYNITITLCSVFEYNSREVIEIICQENFLIVEMYGCNWLMNFLFSCRLWWRWPWWQALVAHSYQWNWAHGVTTIWIVRTRLGVAYARWKAFASVLRTTFALTPPLVFKVSQCLI